MALKGCIPPWAALGVERFRREIRTHARLQHSHILTLFDSGIAAGRLFPTMPQVEAGTLRAGGGGRSAGTDPPSGSRLTETGVTMGTPI